MGSGEGEKELKSSEKKHLRSALVSFNFKLFYSRDGRMGNVIWSFWYLQLSSAITLLLFSQSVTQSNIVRNLISRTSKKSDTCHLSPSDLLPTHPLGKEEDPAFYKIHMLPFPLVLCSNTVWIWKSIFTHIRRTSHPFTVNYCKKREDYFRSASPLEILESSSHLVSPCVHTHGNTRSVPYRETGCL